MPTLKEYEIGRDYDLISKFLEQCTIFLEDAQKRVKENTFKHIKSKKEVQETLKKCEDSIVLAINTIAVLEDKDCKATLRGCSTKGHKHNKKPISKRK